MMFVISGRLFIIFKDVNGTTVSFFFGQNLMSMEPQSVFFLRSDAKGVTQFHYIFFIFVDDDCHVEN